MASQLSPTDAELSAKVRSGDREAFGVLWRRHSDSAFIVARQYRGIADPQDIVQEASRRVLNAILRGGGPFGDFRPYMNQTVRNVAVSWSREHSADPVSDINTFAEQAIGGDAPDYADSALERMITVRAFKSLPKRWQTVLWYTYVEGMGSDEAADHLGLSRNAAAALIGRAREGLRQAWLKAHVADDQLPAECRWTVDMLPSLERDDITDRQREKAERHLARCPRCAIIAAEVNDLASQLPILLLPLVVAGFDVLGSDVNQLLAYDPTSKTAGGTSGTSLSSAADTPLPRPTGPNPGSIRGGMTKGRIWLLSSVVVGGALAIVLIANWPSGEDVRIPVPDAIGQSLMSPRPSSGAVEEPDPTAQPEESSPPEESPAPTAPDPAPRSTPRSLPVPPPPGEESLAVDPDPAPVPVEPIAVTVPVPSGIVGPMGPLRYLGAAFTFTGDGEPGATIELLNGSTVVGTAVVGADGKWSIAPTSVTLTGPDSVTLSARQRTAEGVSATVNAGHYVFEVPSTGLGNSPGPGAYNFAIQGDVGARVLLSVDGGAPTEVTLTGANTIHQLTGLSSGKHTVTIRYTDGAQSGATVVKPIVVN